MSTMQERVATVEQKLLSHEEQCVERMSEIRKQIKSIHDLMLAAILGIVGTATAVITDIAIKLLNIG